MRLALKRAYDTPSEGDGVRVLVDRRWPRGVRKEDARIDHWLQDVAPSDHLRRWFNHEAEKWDGFRRRYAEELDERTEFVMQLIQLAESGKVTLVYGARDREHNNAVALKAYLEEQQIRSTN
ncbi:MAG: DUF488 family protein [Caldilineaceae bacterium]|nr:DUF488 family protein [Caldilineaceae bacterium]